MKKEMGLFALGAIVGVLLLGGASALNLRTDGIQFTDGTMQTTAAVPGLRVVDSLNQTVGPVIARGATNVSSIQTYLTLGPANESVFFDLERDLYFLIHRDEIYFSEPNCTGDAYIGRGTGPDYFTDGTFAFGAPGTVFKADFSQQSEGIVGASRWGNFDRWQVGDFTDYCENNPGGWTAKSRRPAVQLADLSTLPYVPDFRLE